MKKTKNYQKLSNILFIIGFSLICLCGCSGEQLPGEEKVEKAREDFSKLHSGVITVTNIDTGEVEQTLTFKYDEVGILLYSLTGVSEGKSYEQFCNGYETYTFDGKELTKVSKGERDYEAYTYDYRYPMTDREYLYFSPGKITSTTVVEEDNGASNYTYDYKPSAVKGEDALGTLKSFSVKFSFDENDMLESFEEYSTYEKNGGETLYGYRITVSQRDSVGKLEMPENIKKLSGK